MNKNASLTISLIIITGLIVFGGSFLVAMYFMDPGVTRDTADKENYPHLGKCDGEKIYTSFQEALSNPEDVCTLQINDGSLTGIPSDISKLKNLTYLSIIRNNVSNIPAEIGELDKLTTLYLNFNNISSVPEEIGNLENLQRVQLISNNLSSTEQAKIRGLLPNADLQF